MKINNCQLGPVSLPLLSSLVLVRYKFHVKIGSDRAFRVWLKDDLISSRRSVGATCQNLVIMSTQQQNDDGEDKNSIILTTYCFRLSHTRKFWFIILRRSLLFFHFTSTEFDVSSVKRLHCVTHTFIQYFFLLACLAFHLSHSQPS